MGTFSKMFCLSFEKGLLEKERICSPWEQILFFKSRPLFIRSFVCRKKQTGSHKSCLLCNKKGIYQGYPNPLNKSEKIVHITFYESQVIRNVHIFKIK